MQQNLLDTPASLKSALQHKGVYDKDCKLAISGDSRMIDRYKVSIRGDSFKIFKSDSPFVKGKEESSLGSHEQGFAMKSERTNND